MRVSFLTVTRCEECNAIVVERGRLPGARLCRRCGAAAARVSRRDLRGVDRALAQGAAHAGDYHLHRPLNVATALDLVEATEEPAVGSAACDKACPVCQENVDPAVDAVPATRPCGHLLHRVCLSRLQPALTGGVECPLCRTPLTRDDLPFDTSVTAVLHAHRLACAFAALVADHGAEARAAAALELGLQPHHALLYNVCTRAVCNALLHHGAAARAGHKPDLAQLRAHNRVVEQLAHLDED